MFTAVYDAVLIVLGIHRAYTYDLLRVPGGSNVLFYYDKIFICSSRGSNQN